MSGASAIHMNVFGLHPVVVHGNDAQKRRWLPPIIDGHHKACFGVTEPNTGLNTLALKTRAVRKGDRYVVNGQKISQAILGPTPKTSAFRASEGVQALGLTVEAEPGVNTTKQNLLSYAVVPPV